MMETANQEREKAIAVWTEVVEHVLYCVPPSIKREIVAAVVEKTNEPQKTAWTFADIEEMGQGPGLKYWDAINEAMSLVIQVLLRRITNNHSAEGAAKVLFREHRYGTGGCWLPEYLDGLPALTVDLKKAAKIASENGQSRLKFDFASRDEP